MKRKKLNGIKNGLQVVSKTLRFFYNSNSCNNDILDDFTRLKQSYASQSTRFFTK